MDTENKDVEQLNMLENETTEQENTLATDEEFKDAVYAQMRSIHSQGMIVGFQTACHTALNKIYTFENGSGKKSTNDYKRLLKDLKKFFETGISRKANEAETSDQEESIEVETVQN